MKQSDLSHAKRYLRPITYGVLSGAGACMLLLLAVAALMGMRDLPRGAVSVCGILSFVLSGFVAGLVSASLAREKGMLLGLSCGACLFLVILLGNLMLDGSGVGMQAVTKMAAVLLASALGGIIGVNKKKKFKTR